jgi:hypothetical protein
MMDPVDTTDTCMHMSMGILLTVILDEILISSRGCGGFGIRRRIFVVVFCVQ